MLCCASRFSLRVPLKRTKDSGGSVSFNLASRSLGQNKAYEIDCNKSQRYDKLHRTRYKYGKIAWWKYIAVFVVGNYFVNVKLFSQTIGQDFMSCRYANHSSLLLILSECCNSTHVCSRPLKLFFNIEVE